MTKTNYLAIACLPLVTACSTDPVGDAPGRHFQIAAAPLTLPGVSDACYTIEVQNDILQTVWRLEHVCASQYGNSIGAISYVGPCDATDNNNNSDTSNTVTLTLENLYTADVNPTNYALNAIPDSEWDNPCGEYADGTTVSPNNDGYGPCQLVRPCEENEDVKVEFNIAIMRDAEQGFFDVAVNFEDVFCSAKLDCLPAFLHDAEGVRGLTVNMAFACTAGTSQTGPQATNLYLSNVTLSCVDADATDAIVLEPIVQQFNLSQAGPGQQGAAPPLVYQWADYSGGEGFTDFEKCYWNHSFGLDLEAIGKRVCTLSATGTASESALSGGAIAADQFWPVITWDVDVVNANGGLCGPNPLNETTSGVTTGYVTPATTPRPAAFTARYQCAAPPAAPPTYACVGSTDARFEGTYAVGGAPAVKVTVGTVASAAYPLPAGANLVETCCLAECCTP